MADATNGIAETREIDKALLKLLKFSSMDVVRIAVEGDTTDLRKMISEKGIHPVFQNRTSDHRHYSAFFTPHQSRIVLAWLHENGNETTDFVG